MKITRISPLSGKISSMEINVTEEQLDKYYGTRDLIQNIFPNLSKSEREFIKTGITPEEWELLNDPYF